MIIAVIDDEKIMLEGLMRCIQTVKPDAELYGFRRGSDLLAFLEENPVDVIFMDIKMPEIDGLTLGKMVLEIDSDINLIYCTAYDDYISDAFRSIRCNGYIIKPVDEDQVREELKHLRVAKPAEVTPRVRIQCFGRFEIFVDNEPMKFSSVKTKELVAFLVDKCGGVCSNQEIIAALWDDDMQHDSYYKKIRKDLTETLEKYGCEDMIYRQRGGISVNPDCVYCDYYEWRKKNHGSYVGEYMNQYEWAYYSIL